ncbi:hypothetical protein PMAYCL1PPCAC_26758, partial [Pristionchus mayeri]
LKCAPPYHLLYAESSGPLRFLDDAPKCYGNKIYRRTNAYYEEKGVITLSSVICRQLTPCDNLRDDSCDETRKCVKPDMQPEGNFVCKKMLNK